MRMDHSAVIFAPHDGVTDLLHALSFSHPTSLAEPDAPLPPCAYAALPAPDGACTHAWFVHGPAPDARVVLDLLSSGPKVGGGSRVVAVAVDAASVARAWLGGAPEAAVAAFEASTLLFSDVDATTASACAVRRALFVGHADVLAPQGDIVSARCAVASGSSGGSVGSLPLLSEEQCSVLSVFFRLVALELDAALVAAPRAPLDATLVSGVRALLSGVCDDGGGSVESASNSALLPWNVDTRQAALAVVSERDRNWAIEVAQGGFGGARAAAPPSFVDACAALPEAVRVSLLRAVPTSAEESTRALDAAVAASTVPSFEAWGAALAGVPAALADAARATPRLSLAAGASAGVGPRAGGRRSISGPGLTAPPPQPPPTTVAAAPAKDPKRFFAALLEKKSSTLALFALTIIHIMSLHSIGVDIVSIARIARVHARFGTRFLERAFHAREAERAALLPPHRVPEFLASRWAAKEALHKAAQTERFLFPDVEITNAPSGSPSLMLHGAAAKWARGNDYQLHLSLSHEADFAVAFVVISRAQR